MTGEVVTLTRHEAALAAQVGVRRELEALERGRAHRHGFQGDGWSVHIEGAGAELAVAKRFGRYWEAVVDDPAELAGDVGRAQVRSTKRDDGCLILHPDDPDDSPFFLVIGRIPTFRIAGWIIGREGKQPGFWRADLDRPAYFVPQGSLRPLGPAKAVAA